MATLQPLPGFDWNKVNWGGPNEMRTEHCSYCGDPLPEHGTEAREMFIPLVVSTNEGRVAEFCDHCQATWWGIQHFDEPVAPRPEPEVLGARIWPAWARGGSHPWGHEQATVAVRSCRVCGCTDDHACPAGAIGSRRISAALAPRSNPARSCPRRGRAPGHSNDTQRPTRDIPDRCVSLWG
jgi:hypothetical protein